MVDTRRSVSVKSKAKSAASSRQRTLLDLFPAKSIPVSSVPVPAEQVTQDEPATLVGSASTNTEDTAGINIVPVVEKLRQTSLEPRPQFASSLPSPSLAESLLEQDIVIDIEGDEAPSRPLPTCSDSITLIEESGSQENPIVVETKPLKPLRSYKPSTSKPLAPLFVPRPKTAPVPSPPRSPEAVLLGLPDAAKPKFAPIFAPRPSKATPSLSNQRLSKAKEVVAPFPNKEWQHVRGPQHGFTASSIPYNRLVKHVSGPTLASYKAGSLKQFLTEKDIKPSIQISTTSIPFDKDTYMDTIPDEHREHPAISRLATAPQSEESAHRLWVDKWRPTRAAEILGNEDNAIYLRDWIRALELQLETDEAGKEENPAANVKGKGKAKAEASRGTKRPRVVREVEKKRKKKRRVDSEDEEDDYSWIVYDTEYSSSAGASSPVSRPSPPPDLGHARLEHNRSVHHTFTSLTNTILLAGPSGSGKTAAVYACAEELGWDVLEVYPGIGRRNGAGIDSLIGDAGKNHHVRKGRTGKADVVGVCGRQYLKGGDICTPKGDEGVELAEIGPLSCIAADSLLGPPSVRQSLILLEEVDILFKDDTNFWPAVTNFIKECRRPVICTCNDISLVPTLDLPLQAILTFQPCAPQLAASYLQALCFHEDRYLLERETLVGIYEDSAAKVGDIDFPDIPNPATGGDFPSADLRRTMNGLQFQCASASGKQGDSGWERDEDREGDMCDKVSADPGVCRDFALATRHAELVSYADTYLRRGPWESSEGAAWSSCEASEDDEMGHRMLFWARGGSWGEGSGDTAAEWVSRGGGSKLGGETRELFRARVEHQSATRDALEGLVPEWMLATRRREVHVDYASRIREIVAAEDEREREHVERGRRGRGTRNSGGTYERNVPVSAQGRAALDRTVLM